MFAPEIIVVAKRALPSYRVTIAASLCWIAAKIMGADFRVVYK